MTGETSLLRSNPHYPHNPLFYPPRTLRPAATRAESIGFVALTSLIASVNFQLDGSGFAHLPFPPEERQTHGG